MNKSSEILSVSDQIAIDILRSILRGKIKLGQKLPTEATLAKEYGVSRPTIRNALITLENENILKSKQGCQGGWYVTDNNPASVAKHLGSYLSLLIDSNQITSKNLWEVRNLIEVKACGLAAVRRTSEDLQAIAAAIPVDYANLSDYEYHSQDIEFHRRIAEATHNPLIVLIVNITTMVQELYAMTSPAPEKRRQELNKNLFEIYEAIFKQDVRQAEEAMAKHLQCFKQMSGNVSFG
ncbi:MAG: FadR family transcriptional regulator [Syntrophomonadaceae bacterium]|nr:FadR family transcriptional regulator [Syntrophomonadaceae bacterium]